MEAEEKKADEIVQETAPETSEVKDESKPVDDPAIKAEEVQFSDEQKAKINEIIKENINKIKIKKYLLYKIH